MIKNLKSKSNLTQRVVAALIGAPLVIGSILYSPNSFWFIFLAISVLTQYEFYKLLGMNGSLPLKLYGTFCGASIITITYLVETYTIGFESYYLIVPLLTLTFFIKLYRKKDPRPFENLGYTFLGTIYVALPFALLMELTFWEGIFRPMLPVGILIILWVNDSGAYFSGMLFGKRKLFERISPKKTWEGFIGGAIFGILAAFIFSRYVDVLDTKEWLMVAVIIVITGTLGDLVESLFKRSIDIKDSGSLIPGHGGFLDRFDGLLLSMPFIISFLKLYELLN
ncbi:MAG: phosphatidate cytidylyltransferase [Cytophagaceae bacterium]|nr:phosphatidate cytidylyltransferase [Cytophagaceae bacterium]MBL0327788.1 phosphatidate cytidylyltransferase [Cytophagaceae bacterium]